MARPAKTTAAHQGSVVVVLPDPRSGDQPSTRRSALRKVKPSSVTYLPPMRGKTAEDIIAEQAEREQGKTFYRLRRHLAPWYIATGLAATATATWLTELAVDPTLVAGTTALAVAAIGGTVWHQTRSSIPRVRGTYPLRRRAAQASIAASAWLTYAAATGPSWYAAATLAAGTAAFGAGWWRANRIPNPTAPPVLDKSPRDPGMSVAEEWDMFVANPRGPVPGSRLSNRKTIAHGVEYTCQLDRGAQQTLTTVMARLESIATNMNTQPEHLVIEPHPSGLPSLVLVKFVEGTPLSDANVDFTGPRYRDGLAELGPYADGEDEYTWRLWTPGGTDNESDGSAWSGFICGGTGMGKSRLLENLAISAVSSGHVVVWFADGQHGGSSPALMGGSDWYVDLEGSTKMLAALERIVEWRSKENAANGWTGYVPSAERPLLLVILDESHMHFKDAKSGQRWGRIARTCRKVGVALVCASQYAGLESFGQNDALRAAVMAGNGLCMRTESKINGQLIVGLPVDPTTLPRIAGYGYACDSPVTRSAPWRNRLVRNAAAWLERYTQPRLDALTVKAAGKDYAARATSADEVRAVTHAEIAAFLGGELPTDDYSEGYGDDYEGAIAVPAFPTWEESAARVEAAELDELAAVDMGEGLTLGDLAQGMVDAQAVDAGTARQAVLDALDAGATSPADLQTTTGRAESTVRLALKDLIAAGEVVKTGRGAYARRGTTAS